MPERARHMRVLYPTLVYGAIASGGTTIVIPVGSLITLIPMWYGSGNARRNRLLGG
jgi:hypothetical protein